MMETMMNENNQQQKEVEMEELQQLLKDVYEATKDIKQEKAEAFDVVGICIGRQETIHSKFLAELLNPHGSHGLGSVFLKAFYEQIGLKDFHSEGCSVRTEVICEEKGKKKEQEKDNEGQESNGRTDIVIKNSKELVVIENKIYAKDQQDQLQNYDKWMKDEHPEDNGKVLLYLTLDGHEASNPGDTSYKRISYKDDILRWLEKCIYIAEENNAFTKATLVQYQELIKKLTGEHMNPSIKDAVTSATTTNAQNYLAAALTAKAFDGIHQNVLRDIVKKASEETRNEENEWLLGKEMDWKIGTNNNKQFSISYTPKGKQYKLFFEFQSRGNYQDLYYGLHDLNSDNGPHPYKAELLTIPEDLKRDFGEKEIGKKANDHGWIVYIIASDNTIDKTMWTPESLALKHWKNNFADLKDKIKLYIKDLIAIINQNKEKLDNPNQQ